MSTVIDNVRGEVRPESAREPKDGKAPEPRHETERLRLLLRRLEQRRARLEAD